ncbi:MAG: nicotinamide riboside transporter PnuC [Flavobacterium sp.]|jgi:nicotinamide mononucleotide transporter|uniref:nicotinamide riboside transporter PnuC n=1 Tax=Flavobacterium sp. TaxID=239 RepID=UPI00273500BC|nr:nicotinamide riboside transporter PnuC [Flavobacterium sp.]MDP3680907.1 nicotinamide riboside transporter PnuC [Flavobacterium sp.]MDZ4329835.1 nicotinamide riboside transporter PnuC [Flavobacterium sp.]
MIEYFFSQYADYPTLDIVLEIVAVVFGLLSVWYAKKDNILVFPTGLVSTSIYVYLLWKWTLWGDMMINGYYFVMSIYGWYHWTRKKDDTVEFPISKISSSEKRIAIILFIFTVAFVVSVYQYFGKFTTWYAYVDTFITGIFFVGMWLMAKRKVENWVFWIIGDVISIPLYFSKGFTFTSFQYIVFTIVAIFGYLEWKKISDSSQTELQK